jgi:glycosyltransferase involved in cell wall biosynthesis
MKIYFNTYSVAFQSPGGGEIQLLKSKEALERRGHEVVLFDQWKHRLEDADVVHQFSVQGGTYNLCAYAHKNHIPLVLSPILWLSEYLDQYPMDEIDLMIQMADVICTNSHAEVARFQNHIDVVAEKYFVTHNGVDANFFDHVTPELFLSNYRIREPFVLCVGNIEARKNQLLLLEASNRLGLHVVLIGNVRDHDYFAQINARFSGCFSFLGYLDHSSLMLRSAYAACSVFALPSLLETPGLAALEAAAVGARIVITKEGCTEEYFGGDALYVNPRSVDDIVDKVIMATNGFGLGTVPKERIQEFTWDHLAIQLECAYSKAINAKK